MSATHGDGVRLETELLELLWAVAAAYADKNGSARPDMSLVMRLIEEPVEQLLTAELVAACQEPPR